MIAYRQAQLEEEEEETTPTEPENPAAPPAYTPVAGSGRDPKAGLPEYTESDPFAASGTADAGDTELQSQPPTQLSTDTHLDDVPLITDDEEAV